MKIAHIIWSLEFGGIERLVLDLATAQRDLYGHDVCVVAGNGSGRFASSFRDRQIDVHPLHLKSGWDVHPRKIDQCVQLLRERDVVQIHTFNPAMARAAVKSTRPIVYTEHGNFGFGRKRAVTDSMKYFLQSRFLNRYPDYITFNSKFTRTIGEQRYGLRSVERSVVYNGIDVGTNRQVSSIPESFADELANRFVVGTSSRFVAFKRIDRLIESFATFRKGKESQVALLLVGDGPEIGKLRARVVDLGLEDATVFAGYQRNVASFQARMDVCVFPSCNEPFGLVAVEALCLGKPAVVFRDGGGICEIVGAWNSADVVADVSECARRLDDMYCQRRKLPDGRAARIAYGRRFSIARMTGEVQSILNRVVNA